MGSFSLRFASAEQRYPSLVVAEDPEANYHRNWTFGTFDSIFRSNQPLDSLVLCFFGGALSLKVCSLEAARPAQVLTGGLGREHLELDEQGLWMACAVVR